MYREIFEDYNNCGKNQFIAEWKEDSIHNILTYFKISTLHPTFSRIYYDGDARYFHTHFPEKGKTYAERGDIMVSFFTPYKYAIQKAIGETYNKGNIEDLEKLLELKDTNKLREVNQKFEWFAQNYMKRGNILLLPPKKPDGRMNPNKYKCSQDRIDKAILECFPDGALAKYFDSEEALNKWILDEHLEVLFNEKKISKENIFSLVSEIGFKRYEEMELDEIFAYIDKVKEIIIYRDRLLDISKSIELIKNSM